MLLTKYNLKNITSKQVSIPDLSLFEFPEKVLQFGTGSLLRGLPDYFIDKANKQGIFGGRIVVVKSTEGPGAIDFEKQDGLYTICVRGIEHGVPVEENIICSSISRVLSARSEWNRILECAHNPQMAIIISNTTEVGIELVHDDILRMPPVSYPGKLLAFLYERYKAFAGSKQSGMVILPTELITDNGRKLESIVTELAYLNGLDEQFIDWLENSNHFCNTLVDRIVPGKPHAERMAVLESGLGYADQLLIMCESYRLWAIEGDDEMAKRLGFARADEGVVITKDINLFREMKLRLLNGTHTLSCGVAHLAGIGSVRAAMENEYAGAYISRLMMDEIVHSIPYPVSPVQAESFAGKVLDRFRNTEIEHLWLSITAHYTSKMRSRVVPMLQHHYTRSAKVPELMALGFAAYILFMKATRLEKNTYSGTLNGNAYMIKDEKAAYFYKKWQTVVPARMANAILRDIALWGNDLTTLPGFADAVQEKLDEISERGMMAVLQSSETKKIAV